MSLPNWTGRIISKWLYSLLRLLHLKESIIIFI